MKKPNNLKKISKSYIYHYFNFFARSVLFIVWGIIYLLNRTGKINTYFPIFLVIVWLFFIIEMIIRSIPTNIESIGCQKHFSVNYNPNPNAKKLKLQSWKKTLLTASVWLALNAVVGFLYFTDIIDKGFLILISLAYSVGDIVCILFFCPFKWLMKNRCCTTCRVYNWDYPMMFTPYVFFASFFSWSLLGMALFILLKWEITYKRHPERFTDSTNLSLTCANCKEKNCMLKNGFNKIGTKSEDKKLLKIGSAK